VRAQEALSSKPCWAKRQSRHQAADPSPCSTSASSHLHPHVLAGEPDSFSWPRSNVWFLNPAMRVQLRARPFATISQQALRPAAGSGELMQPMLPLATAQPDCPFAEADTYMPGVVCARQQSVKALKLQMPFGCMGRTMYARIIPKNQTKSNGTCGVRTHALSEWRGEPPP
jgi:hypothetical protein